MTQTVKMMVDGVWMGDLPDGPELRARRAESTGRFRHAVSADGSTPFPAEAGRYHLYVSYACPWAHRTILYRRLKRLEGIIGMSVLHPRWGGPDGWTFGASDLSTVDHAGGRGTLHEVYAAAAADYTGKVTVPVLWDRKTGTIVNNQSGDIIRMLDNAFHGIGGDAAGRFRPDALARDVDALNAWLLPELCEGVYAAGFARTQQGYEAAVRGVFAALDRLEGLLSDGRAFLLGDRVTEPDWHLFCTLVRFEDAYRDVLRCTLRPLEDYPSLLSHRKRLTAVPGVADTVRPDHIRRHYHDILGEIEPDIVPLRPLPARIGT